MLLRDRDSLTGSNPDFVGPQKRYKSKKGISIESGIVILAF